jgi:hypothetical protein
VDALVFILPMIRVVVYLPMYPNGDKNILAVPVQHYIHTYDCLDGSEAQFYDSIKHLLSLLT